MTAFTQKGSSKRLISRFCRRYERILAPDVIDGHMINNKTTNEIVADSSLKEDGLELGTI